MKKKLILAALAALLAAGAVFAFAACGLNSSPESVVKGVLKAGYNLDAGKYVDAVYFENKDDKKRAEEETEEALSSEILGEILGEGGELSLKMKGKLTEFEFTSDTVSDDVLEAMRAVYGDYIEEIASYSVTYTVELSYEVSMKAGEGSDAALDASGERTLEDQKQSGYVYKIDGKWYIEIVPAGESA